MISGIASWQGIDMIGNWHEVIGPSFLSSLNFRRSVWGVPLILDHWRRWPTPAYLPPVHEKKRQRPPLVSNVCCLRPCHRKGSFKQCSHFWCGQNTTTHLPAIRRRVQSYSSWVWSFDCTSYYWENGVILSTETRCSQHMKHKYSDSMRLKSEMVSTVCLCYVPVLDHVYTWSNPAANNCLRLNCHYITVTGAIGCAYQIGTSWWWYDRHHDTHSQIRSTKHGWQIHSCFLRWGPANEREGWWCTGCTATGFWPPWTAWRCHTKGGRLACSCMLLPGKQSQYY